MMRIIIKSTILINNKKINKKIIKFSKILFTNTTNLIMQTKIINKLMSSQASMIKELIMKNVQFNKISLNPIPLIIIL